MIVYLNGRFVPREEAHISPEDRGFLFADAIYEVVRFGAGRPYRLAAHLERMRYGLTEIRIPADPSFFPGVASRLLAENRLENDDALVYAQVSRGAAPRYHAFPPEGTPPTVFAYARLTDPPPPPDGGPAILVPDERWGRCDIKTVMLLPNVLASQRAREAGAIEAILIKDGIAWEGTKANLFAYSAGTIRTAPKGPRILPGVTRGAAVEAAAALGFRIEERPLAVEELFAAEEVFLASTTLWTYSLTEIEGRRIGDGRPGPVATRIREALQAEFRGERVSLGV
ncbi:MAG TPA: aminotransferase class IV [Thermoanaerobaculia bacterium]|nr:aminotransferase class IV [Thermoanaerobaculia bacterium]